MKIEKIIIENFRSFERRQEIILNNVTGAIGGNGVGKTSFLLALNRLFGLTQKDRGIRNEDFYVTPGTSIDDENERNLVIEVKLVFPELLQEGASLDSVAECFRNMIIDYCPEGNSVPYCRVRLESTYNKDQFGDGDIKTKVRWVRTPYINDEEVESEEFSDFTHADRERIKVIYVPASRDPHSQLQEFSGSLLGRFVKSIMWTTSPEETLKNSVETARATLDSEEGVAVINDKIKDTWSNLSPSFRSSEPRLSFIDDDVKKMLKNVSMDFDNGDDRQVSKLDDLSDGEKSLFYFSLLKSALDLKKNMINSEEVPIGDRVGTIESLFDSTKLGLPSLTLLAIEEPENHLSPHHFGHLIESFRSIAEGPNSQAVFSSHSSSIISRLDPEDIRYFRISDFKSIVKSIKLPEEASTAYTYVKEAVKAYPELYFSRLVVLGEGDSEEVILKRLIEAKGMPLDRSMISVVPLSGRFVNHFWRLLNDLDIPFITLLDLDMGKDGAAWGRIKYCINQLIDIGYSLNTITSSITQEQLDRLHEAPFLTVTDQANLMSWTTYFEESYSVFFSSKLDIDYMMYSKFCTQYNASIVAPAVGPRQLPQPSDNNYQEKIRDLEKTIFGEGANCIQFYDPVMLNYYKYLFLGKGKPLTHSLVLNNILDVDLLRNCPEVLLRLVEKVESKLTPTQNIEIFDDENAE